jgi:MFS family permease
MVGLGAVFGAPLVTLINRRLAEKSIMLMAVVALGALLMAFSFSRTYWLLCLLSAGIGCSYLMLGVCVNTVVQARSDPAIRGRLTGYYSLAGLGMFPLGGMLLGWLADRYGALMPIRLGAAVCIGLAALLFALPGLISGADSSLGIG